MLLYNLELAHENISNSNECRSQLYLSSVVGHRVRCVPTQISKGYVFSQRYIMQPIQY